MTQSVLDLVYRRRRLQGANHSVALYDAEQWQKRQCVYRWIYCTNLRCESEKACALPYGCDAKTHPCIENPCAELQIGS